MRSEIVSLGQMANQSFQTLECSLKALRIPVEGGRGSFPGVKGTVRMGLPEGDTLWTRDL